MVVGGQNRRMKDSRFLESRIKRERAREEKKTYNCKNYLIKYYLTINIKEARKKKKADNCKKPKKGGRGNAQKKARIATAAQQIKQAAREMQKSPTIAKHLIAKKAPNGMKMEHKACNTTQATKQAVKL